MMHRIGHMGMEVLNRKRGNCTRLPGRGPFTRAPTSFLSSVALASHQRPILPHGNSTSRSVSTAELEVADELLEVRREPVEVLRRPRDLLRALRRLPRHC